MYPFDIIYICDSHWKGFKSPREFRIISASNSITSKFSIAWRFSNKSMSSMIMFKCSENNSKNT